MNNASLPKAALWMAGWLACMTTLAVAGRETTSDLPVFVVLVLRSTIALAAITPFVLWNSARRPQTSRAKLHLGRNIVHFSAQYAWFFALTLIPLAQVVSIEFSMPIWTAILATIFLGERLTGLRIAAVALGFAGIVIIVRPATSSIELGQLVALFAAFGFAGSVTMTKLLTRSDSAFTILFYMLLIQTLIGLGPAIYVWHTPAPHLWPWLVVLAFCGTTSHYCMARAMAHADAMVVVPMDFLRVPLTALAGLLIYNEGVDGFVVAGAALILAGNMANLKQT